MDDRDIKLVCMNIQNTTKFLIRIIVLNFLISSTALAFKAKVNASYSYDNNVYRVQDKKPSNIMNISPELADTINYSRYSLSALYKLNAARYIELSREDYNNHDFSLKFSSDSRSRYSIKSGYSYTSSLDPRGKVGNKTVSNDESDRWVRHSFDSTAAYFPDKKKRLYKFGVLLNTKRYSLIDSKVKDVNNTSFRLIYEYKLTGKSAINYLVSYSRVVFPSSEVTNFDSTDMSYLIGGTWATTGKLTTKSSLGYKTRKLLSGDDQKYSNFIADLEVTWLKKSFSRYSLRILRESQSRPDLESNNSLSNAVIFKWSHVFTRKFSTNLGANLNFTNYGSGQSDTKSGLSFAFSYKKSHRIMIGPSFYVARFISTKSEEKSTNYSVAIKAEYNATRWLDISPRIEWKTFTSTELGQEYDNYVAKIIFTFMYSR